MEKFDQIFEYWYQKHDFCNKVMVLYEWNCTFYQLKILIGDIVDIGKLSL